MLKRNGLININFEVVQSILKDISSEDIVKGFVMANPTIFEIKKRANRSLDEIIKTFILKIENKYGSDFPRIPMQEIAFIADKKNII